MTLYCIDGKHKPEKPSPKLVDNGTLEFCSRDAHAGLPPARRSDLEILVFNLIHWLSTSQGDAPAAAGLPWMPLISSKQQHPLIIKNSRLDDPEISCRLLVRFKVTVPATRLKYLSRALWC